MNVLLAFDLTALELAVGFVCGAGIGLIYFAALWRTVQLNINVNSVSGTILFTVARFIFAIAGFWLLARWSGPALLSGAVGFKLSRFGARWLVGEKP